MFLHQGFSQTVIVIVKNVTAIPAVKALNTVVILMHVFTLALLICGDVLLPGIFNWSTSYTVFTYLVIIDLIFVKKVNLRVLFNLLAFFAAVLCILMEY